MAKKIGHFRLSEEVSDLIDKEVLRTGKTKTQVVEDSISKVLSEETHVLEETRKLLREVKMDWRRLTKYLEEGKVVVRWEGKEQRETSKEFILFTESTPPLRVQPRTHIEFRDDGETLWLMNKDYNIKDFIPVSRIVRIQAIG